MLRRKPKLSTRRLAPVAINDFQRFNWESGNRLRIQAHYRAHASSAAQDLTCLDVGIFPLLKGQEFAQSLIRLLGHGKLVTLAFFRPRRFDSKKLANELVQV